MVHGVCRHHLHLLCAISCYMMRAMNQEIERKFLVQDTWRNAVQQAGKAYRQGYLCSAASALVRVRTIGSANDGQGVLTIKGSSQGIVRPEYEYSIPWAEAQTMLHTLCAAVVEKLRYRIVYAGMTWEVDEFAGANQGLVTAEIELEQVEQSFARPPWLGREVSHDSRYTNARLAQRPFSQWSADERSS